MNKEELINQIAGDAGINKTQAKAALESFTDSVKKSLKKGGKSALLVSVLFLKVAEQQEPEEILKLVLQSKFLLKTPSSLKPVKSLTIT